MARLYKIDKLALVVQSLREDTYQYQGIREMLLA